MNRPPAAARRTTPRRGPRHTAVTLASVHVLLGLTMLAGCARLVPLSTTPAVPPEASWERHRAQVLGLASWSFTGRIGVQRGNEGWNAGIRWQQSGAQFQLRILAPLGRGTLELRGDDERVELTDEKGAVYTARDVETLMDEHLGWHLPLRGARYWVVGAPAPATAIERIETNHEGMLAELTQSGWRISILRYLTGAAGALPGKLYLAYGDVRVRMVITAWQTNAL